MISRRSTAEGRVSLSVVALAGVICAACGGPSDASRAGGATSGGELTVAENTNAPPPEPPPQVAAEPAQTGRGGSGRSAEDPVVACGPTDSYRYVAGEFECPEGGNPLTGDPAAAARARVGNVGANSTGHIIDLYRVPCPSGPVDVYVDMYGCPEAASMLGE